MKRAVCLGGEDGMTEEGFEEGNDLKNKVKKGGQKNKNDDGKEMMLEERYLNGGCFVPVFLPDTVRDTFLIDPAVILIVVGVVMFFITFCGCIGALRENIRLLKTVIDTTHY